MSEYVVIAGTRPEIIKIAPLIRRIQRLKLGLFFIHTGQHHDYSLSKQIINDLALPQPDLSFELQSSSPAAQIGEIMGKLEEPLGKAGPKWVIIQGDTNSVLASALTAAKMRIPIAHVEAGLRSYDWRMPEEHNRRLVDHISDVLFAPTKQSQQNLIAEKVHGQVYLTGNTVIDAINEHMPIAAKKSLVLNQIRFAEFVLITIHRSENVDNSLILESIVKALIHTKLPMVIPLHPRTEKRLCEFGLIDRINAARNIQIIHPQGYLDFLRLMKASRFIVTDSGGIQEEATSPLLLKRTLVLRASTERPEAVEVGIAKLIKLRYPEIKRAILAEWKNDKRMLLSASPFGSGHSSKKMIDILSSDSRLVRRRERAEES